MRSWLSIKARISVLVLILGLSLIAVSHVRTGRLLEERSLARIEREARAACAALAGGMQHAFRKGQRLGAELDMSYASLSPDLELGLVCDSADVVRFATRLQWRGVPLVQTPAARAVRLAAGSRTFMDGKIGWDDGHTKLLAVFPFYESHDPARKGVVILSYDANLSLVNVRADALHESFVRSCQLGAICLLLWLVLDWLVARRVGQVLEFTRVVSEGGPTPPVPPGGDELAVIAHSFADAIGKLYETEARLLEAAEEERRRIGRDIHDDVCQRIAAAQLKSGVLGTMLDGGDPETAALAGEVTAELRDTAAIARMFARGLAPVWVRKEGLATALDEWAGQMQKMFHIRCEVECDLGERSLGVWVQTHVFRIVQEVATNAARHAKPSLVRIRLRVADDVLRVEVENDGQPFTAPDPDSRGLGLHFLQQRVRALGGKLSFGLRHGDAGTTITWCEVPLSSTHFNEQQDRAS